MIQLRPIHPVLDEVLSLDTLKDSLISGGIELSQWGAGRAKSVENLLDEIHAGETRLETDPLVRVLSGVVQVIIRRDDGRILIENEQVFVDGRRRARNIPPAEKMLPHESVPQAARRCLMEELQIHPDDIEIYPDTITCREESRLSWSYPGLSSLYTIHRIEACVRGIPINDFSTSEHDNPGETAVAEHHWVWKDYPLPGTFSNS